MFNFGMVEILIILGLGYFAFRGFLIKRYPNFHKAFQFVFFGTAALILVFGLISRFK